MKKTTAEFAVPEEIAIEVPVDVAPPAAEVRTAEQWAEAKGLYPEFLFTSAPFGRAGDPPIRSHNPQFFRFAGAKAGLGWPIGKELTEAEFDAALDAVANHRFG